MTGHRSCDGDWVRIINTVLQVIVNTIDHRMNIREAISAPRVHHQWMPDRLVMESAGFSADVLDALRARGHAIEFRRNIGDCHAIMIDPATGVRLGAADPRSDSRAMAY